MCAARVVEKLDQAWQRPVRHNARIERAALFYALIVDQQREEAFQPINPPELLLPADIDTDTHYGLQAGLRTVEHQLPFTPPQRRALLAPDVIREYEFASEAVERRSPLAVATWHQWLWTTRREGRRTIAEPSAASSVLYEGCTRLAQSLNVILQQGRQAK
jgi:hypothetical protein